MLAWLSVKIFGLARGRWIGIAICLVAVTIALFHIRSEERKAAKGNQEIGRQLEREETLQETVKQVEKANEAREELRAPGAAGDCARYAVCLRSARNPAQCQRFLPEQSADNGQCGARSGSGRPGESVRH